MSLIPAPEGLSGPVAALAEPLGCCLNALNQVKTEAGARVLILGAGPVGLLMALAVHARGAMPFLVEKDPAKLALSGAFRDGMGIPAQSMPSTDEFDVCVNAASSLDTFPEGIDRLRPGGQFCIFSGFPSDEEVSAHPVNEIHYRQLRVAGAYGCTKANLIEALRVLGDYQGPAELLIERVITLDQVAGVMERIAAGRSMKIVVRFDGEP